VEQRDTVPAFCKRNSQHARPHSDAADWPITKHAQQPNMKGTLWLKRPRGPCRKPLGQAAEVSVKPRANDRPTQWQNGTLREAKRRSEQRHRAEPSHDVAKCLVDPYKHHILPYALTYFQMTSL
jgi:hypothetical protein